MPKCNVRLKANPSNVIIWITTEQVPGNPDSNICGSQQWSDESIETDGGVAVVPLECGGRYCLKYKLLSGGEPGKAGEIALYCERAGEPFDRLIFIITDDGRAEGQQCFVVACEEEE